jgi:hypothetical protein
VGTAPATSVRIPPPRKRARFSKRLAWRLFTRVLMAGALIALALLVGAPERHAPCASCQWEHAATSLGNRGPLRRIALRALGAVRLQAPRVNPGRQAFLFGAGNTRCGCSRHPELDEWFTIAREWISPNPTPPPTPAALALGGRTTIAK